MMELIVLGIIPGTQIQLSPFYVIVLWTVVVVAVRGALHMRRCQKILEAYEQSTLYFTLASPD